MLRFAASFGLALAAVLTFPAGARPGVSAAADGTWAGLPPPPASVGNSLVYDSHRDRMLMFAGGTREAWALDLAADSSWRSFPTEGAPALPSWHVAVYDPVRDRVVAYGGAATTTWELPLAGAPVWAPIAAQGAGPGPLSMASAIYDPVRDRVVIFAGMDTLHHPRGEAWALSLADPPTWTQLTPPGSDNVGLPRYAHAATYDSRHDRMLVFGGIQDGLRLSSVWACDFAGGTGWSVIAAAGVGPTARLGAAAAYDSLADALVVHGGYDGGFPKDTRVLSLAGAPTWSALADAPRGRYWAAAAFDPVRERLVVSGGKDSLSLADTWTLGLGANPGWAPLGAAAPEPRTMASVIFDAPRGRFVMFGGHTLDAMSIAPYRNDVWEFTPATGAWRTLVVQGTPPAARAGHTAIYDPVRQRMLVFGGSDGLQYHQDLWALSLEGAPQWTPLGVGDSVPDPRWRHVAAYDPLRDRMVIAGGWLGPWNPDIASDAWTLPLSGAPLEWTRVPVPVTLPLGLAEAGAAFDPVRDQLVVFGGSTDPFGSPTNDTWALEFGGAPHWKYLVGGTPPSPRLAPVAAYDPIEQRLVVFGGATSRTWYLNTAFDETWELSLLPGGQWRRLAPSGRIPNGRSDAAAAFDPARDRLFVYGGQATSQAWGDAALLSLSSTVSVPPAAVARLAFAAPWPNPASGATRFEFALPARADVTLDVYDVSGRRVTRLAATSFAAGRHTLAWDGRDAAGRETGAGVYFAYLRAGDAHATVRCVRLGGRP